MKKRVIKIGGSLFDQPGIDRRLQAWLGNQTLAQNILIAGGGAIVDRIRSWQSEFELDDATCHWMSIKAMSLTAELVHRWIDSKLIREFDQLTTCNDPSVVFDIFDWFKSQNHLPKTWAVTSDSIAACLATRLHVDELVLLKSSLPLAERVSLAELSHDGFTDPQFQNVASGLPKLRIVNLRDVPEDTELSLEKNRLH